MGYHIGKINKGEFGKFSKIQEEYEEARDALTQNNPIMVLLELSDLIGAIEGYAKTYGMTLDDVMKMKDATHRAFTDGTRKPQTVEEAKTVKDKWILEDLVNGKMIFLDGESKRLRHNYHGWYITERGRTADASIAFYHSPVSMVDILNLHGYTKK